MNWTIDAWSGRVAICSPQIPPDAAIELVGDFGSNAERMRVAELVCQALNEQEVHAKPRKRVAETA